jgi:hypothetical protein
MMENKQKQPCLMAVKSCFPISDSKYYCQVFIPNFQQKVFYRYQFLRFP